MTKIIKYTYLVNPANTLDQNGHATIYTSGNGTVAADVNILDTSNTPFLLGAALEWERVANIDFQFNTNVHNDSEGWLIGRGSIPGAYGQTFPNSSITGGVILLDINDISSLSSGLGFETALHELGHTFMGDMAFFNLPHPPQDSTQTVMTEESDAPYVLTPSILDIKELQAKYGASANNSSATTYSMNGTSITDGAESWQAGSGQKTIITIWDSGAKDVINMSSYTGSGTGHIDLREGFSLSGTQYFNEVGDTKLYIAYNSKIEDAVGTKNSDVIAGNNEANSLDGGGGDKSDALIGGGNNDTLIGGDGNDILAGDEYAPLFKKADLSSSGNDTLIGGKGNDKLFGGDGTDIYLFNDTFGEDIINESGDLGDGKGRIVINGDTLSGSFEMEDDMPDQLWWIGTETDNDGMVLKAGSTLYIYSNDLTADGVITIENFTNDGRLAALVTNDNQQPKGESFLRNAA